MSGLYLGLNLKNMHSKSIDSRLLMRPSDHYDGSTNPRGTRRPDNPLKGIRNPIAWNLDNPCKGIQEIITNRIRSQWPRGLTVPT